MSHHFSVILKAVSFILQESFTNTHTYTTTFFISCHFVVFFVGFDSSIRMYKSNRKWKRKLKRIYFFEICHLDVGQAKKKVSFERKKVFAAQKEK